MVLADVADVAKETGEDFAVADEEYRYDGEELPFEMIPKFERLKANYRGVMSALDEEDLSDVDDTYLKFESMLDAHKVCVFVSVNALSVRHTNGQSWRSSHGCAHPPSEVC